MTIQQKTALIFTAITAAILTLVSVVAYFFMNQFAFLDYYKRLEIRGIFAAKERLEQYNNGTGSIYADFRQQHLEPLPGEKEYFFPIDSTHSFMHSPNEPGLQPSFYNSLLAGKPANQKLGTYFYTGIVYAADTRKYIAIIGALNEDSTRYNKNLKWILIACCLAGTAIAYTLGIVFSRHTFMPVRQIIDRAQTIGVENLHLRLEELHGEDELAELSKTFNDMLSRLETAFETQNNFVSNASHELRTPLTAIYGEADIALSRPRTAEAYEHSLAVILGQAEKLQHLTDSLLNLAQTGFDGKKQDMKPIRIDELLMDAKNTINKIIPGNNVRIDLGILPATENGLIVSGNYQLLKLGITNIIENACKYSNNQPVQVTLTIEPPKLHIIVTDRGIGIPTQELKYIYDPFFRASNTGSFKGYGIGLPLTRNIVRLHKGEINVKSPLNQGTTVSITLPIL